MYLKRENWNEIQLILKHSSRVIHENNLSLKLNLSKMKKNQGYRIW